MTSDSAGPSTDPDDDLRTVSLHKIGPLRYLATNERGGLLPIGSGADPDFTPTELLLAALAGCSAIDVDAITGKRAGPVSFDVTATGVKIRDERGNRLADLRVSFEVLFPPGPDGDRAREVLPRALEMSRDRLCTVGRTIASGEQAEYAATS